MQRHALYILGATSVIVASWGFALFMPVSSVTLPTVGAQESYGAAEALFANGCFWCVEADFEKLPGVTSAVSGYAGGTGEYPTYQDYVSTGHREVVLVTYDPARITYAQLAEYVIKHGDPTDGNGSFHDRGHAYSPALYFADAQERTAAESIVREVDSLNVFDTPLAIAIEPAVKFWPAEEYHQDYAKKNPLKYAYYRRGSGRDAFIGKHWSTLTLSIAAKPIERSWRSFVKPSQEVLRSQLTPLQYQVTQEEGTERPFRKEYNSNKAEGIYIDIVSGEPLYSSLDKYDSGTGWPSFTKPLEPGNIVLKQDSYLVYTRTEVRSKYGDSHLGHVFDDGPQDRGGKRYCMNSAALRFIPKESLVAEGYSEYAMLFK